MTYSGASTSITPADELNSFRAVRRVKQASELTARVCS